MKLTLVKSNFQKMVLLELFLQMGVVELPNSVRCTWDGEVGIAEKVLIIKKCKKKYICILTCNYLSNDKE